MNEDAVKKVGRALDELEAACGAPLPPPGLRAGRRPSAAVAAAGLVALLGVAVAAGLWLGRSPALPPESGVVVERLRIGGQTVEGTVTDIPATGAVVVTGGTQGPGGSASSSPEGS